MKKAANHRIFWNEEELAAFSSMFKELLPTCHEGNFTKFARRVQGKAHIHPRRRRPMAGPSSVSPELREAWFSKFPQAKGVKHKGNGTQQPGVESVTLPTSGKTIYFSIQTGRGDIFNLDVQQAKDLYAGLKSFFG